MVVTCCVVVVVVTVVGASPAQLTNTNDANINGKVLVLIFRLLFKKFVFARHSALLEMTFVVFAVDGVAFRKPAITSQSTGVIDNPEPLRRSVAGGGLSILANFSEAIYFKVFA